MAYFFTKLHAPRKRREICHCKNSIWTCYLCRAMNRIWTEGNWPPPPLLSISSPLPPSTSGFEILTHKDYWLKMIKWGNCFPSIVLKSFLLSSPCQTLIRSKKDEAIYIADDCYQKYLKPATQLSQECASKSAKMKDFAFKEVIKTDKTSFDLTIFSASKSFFLLL